LWALFLEGDALIDVFLQTRTAQISQPELELQEVSHDGIARQRGAGLALAVDLRRDAQVQAIKCKLKAIPLEWFFERLGSCISPAYHSI
jgi:ABC-type transporter Mla MlaB component